MWCEKISLPRARLSISPAGSLAINGRALSKGGQCHLLALCGGAAVNPDNPVAPKRSSSQEGLATVSSTCRDPAAGKVGVGGKCRWAGPSVSPEGGEGARKTPPIPGGRSAWLIPSSLACTGLLLFWSLCSLSVKEEQPRLEGPEGVWMRHTWQGSRCAPPVAHPPATWQVSAAVSVLPFWKWKAPFSVFQSDF